MTREREPLRRGVEQPVRHLLEVVCVAVLGDLARREARQLRQQRLPHRAIAHQAGREHERRRRLRARPSLAATRADLSGIGIPSCRGPTAGYFALPGSFTSRSVSNSRFQSCPSFASTRRM